MYDPIIAQQYNEAHRQQLWKEADHERLVNSIDATTLWERISQIGSSLMARLQHVQSTSTTISEAPASLITSEHRVVRRV